MIHRIEKDNLGELNIPSEALYGIHSQRSFNNFQISSYTTNVRLLKAMAQVKLAAARTNAELGFLNNEIANPIYQACEEIINGKHLEQLKTDAFQGGAGTSTNMNINEVIANRALEILGKDMGEYGIIHPIEHINLHQSTNDVYPSALKIAAIYAFRELSEANTLLQRELQNKEKEFADILTISRTEMQDAVPITLGSQFGAFADAIARDRWRTFKAEERLRSINIGGTAVGTGLTAPRKYIFNVIEKLRQITGLGLSRAENVMDGTANNDTIIEAAGMLSANAANLRKIALDLRFLHYQREIELPALQAGSSIMPGKVNPVIIESVVSGCIRVFSNIRVIEEAVSIGTLQINEFMPLIAFSLLESLELLINAVKTFAEHISGINSNEERCREIFNSSITIITAFLPKIGYKKCEALINEYKLQKNTDVRKYLESKLGLELVSEVLSPSNLMSLGYRG